MRAVFDIRSDSGYDDDLTHRYWFDSRYRPEADRALGDWIKYRQLRRGGGREGYHAAARLAQIERDAADPDTACAVMSDYLPFDSVVPLRHGFGLAEEKPQSLAPPSRHGATLQGRAISIITDVEFAAIVHAGLALTLSTANVTRLDLDRESTDDDAAALFAAVPEEQERRIVACLTNKTIRKASFRRGVLDAYDHRCAFTGTLLIKDGRAEVEAAHLMPVAEHGPDVVQNGIALARTVHWLFDNHMLAVSEDWRLLIASDGVPDEIHVWLQHSRDSITLPGNQVHWPHAKYLKRHRDRFVG